MRTSEGPGSAHIVVCHQDHSGQAQLARALESLGRVTWVDTLEQIPDVLALAMADCLLVDAPPDRRALGVLGRIAAAYPEMSVLAVAGDLPFETARELVRIGARDVLPIPLDPAACAAAVREALSGPADAPAGLHGALIAVTAGKGGVGCTTIALNLAAALAAHGAAVILDADAPPFGTVAAAADFEPGPSIAGLVRQRLPADPRVLRRAAVLHPCGFSTLPLWSSPGELSEVDDTMAAALDGLAKASPFVVVDVGRPVLAPQRFILRRAAGVVMVATLDLLALRNLRQLIDLIAAEAGGGRRLLPVLNRCSGDESYTVEQAASALGQSFAAVLPHAPGLTQRLDRGELPMVSEPMSLWSREVRRIADAIVARRRDDAKAAIG